MTEPQRSQQCPHCGKIYRVPYIYSHLRDQHGILGGKSGRIRSDKITKYASKQAHSKSLELVPLPEANHKPKQVVLHQVMNAIVTQDEDGHIYISEMIR